MSYILGEREFWGLPFKVSPAVLVPRPDSETVIETVLDLFPDRSRSLRLIDLGVGSGCLLLTLLKEYPEAHGVGMDASPEAIEVARSNAEALCLASRATFVVGDWRLPGWVDGLGAPFDLVVSNPPYIESDTIGDLMPEVAAHEPRLALDGGPDGLSPYRIIASEAAGLLVPGGWVVVEGGDRQASEIAGIFAVAGLRPMAPRKDLGGVDRVVASQQ